MFVHVVDGIEWYLRNRERLISEHGGDFAAAINGATGDCVVRSTAGEAREAYARAHRVSPPTLILMGVAS